MVNKISVTVDDNPDFGYERQKWFYLLMLPLILLLAVWVAFKKKILGNNLKTNTFWFDGVSPICRKIKENATGWQALDIIYNYHFGERRGFEGKVTDFWLHILNSHAVRNRLKLVKQKLREEIEKIAKKEAEIRLLSIASGSAQGTIEVLKEFKQKGILIKAIFFDLDQMAVEYGRELSKQANVIFQINFLNKSVRELEGAVNDFDPQIVEMVGFLEYRPREKAIELVKRIYKILALNGVLLVSNTNYNLEIPFLHYVVNWQMIYRSPKQLTEILINGGFEPKNCRIIFEPLKIHQLALCQKSI